MKETYAIVETAGAQFIVSAGDKINVDYLGTEKGKEVEFPRVLLIADGKDTIVGNPTIADAKVTATCLDHVKGDKIVVLRYKNKTRYHKKTGHRQRYTTLQINQIIRPGGVVESAKAPRKRKAKTGDEA
jgi:large subunit ribosomal protein L21